MSVGMVSMLFVNLRSTFGPDAAQRCEDLLQRLREYAAERRLLDLKGSRLMSEVRRADTHLYMACASVCELAERNGMAGDEARMLTNLGDALEAEPSLEAEVKSGTIPVASAAILGEVAKSSDLVRGDVDWRVLARSMTTRNFRRFFLRRRDEASAGEAVIPVTANVTSKTRDEIERARELVARRLRMGVSLGETYGVVFKEWNDREDPLRATPGTRRLPDTSTIPGRRFVPAEVDREVRARSNDGCRVPGCSNRFWVDLSHRKAHAAGGSREADNLDLLCPTHHFLYEEGDLRISGPPSEPVFMDRNGRVLTERNPFLFGEGKSLGIDGPESTGDPPGPSG